MGCLKTKESNKLGWVTVEDPSVTSRHIWTPADIHRFHAGEVVELVGREEEYTTELNEYERRWRNARRLEKMRVRITRQLDAEDDALQLEFEWLKKRRQTLAAYKWELSDEMGKFRHGENKGKSRFVAEKKAVPSFYQWHGGAPLQHKPGNEEDSVGTDSGEDDMSVQSDVSEAVFMDVI